MFRRKKPTASLMSRCFFLIKLGVESGSGCKKSKKSKKEPKADLVLPFFLFLLFLLSIQFHHRSCDFPKVS